MPFPNQVNALYAAGIPGDFASDNVRTTVYAGPGQIVADSAGVTQGRFAWLDSTKTLASNAGSGVPVGFVGRDMAGVITAWLGESSMLLPAGFMVTLFNGGDFYVTHVGGSAATVGMKAYASLTTGAVQFAATGATISGYIETKWFCAAPAAAGALCVMSSYPNG